MTENPSTILLIEDERQMRRFLKVTLHAEGYSVIEAETATDGLSQAATRNPDVVLLDLGLPDMDGLEVIEKLREWSAVPVIVISAREQEGDKIRALDRGADDYLTKPFGAGELLARIRVALRHAALKGQDQEAVFVVEDLRIDFLKRQVFCGTREIHLTPIEYRLLDGSCQECRQGHDPQANPQGGLGTSLCRADPLSACFHEPAQKEDRDRFDSPALPDQRTGHRLSFHGGSRIILNSSLSSSCKKFTKSWHLCTSLNTILMNGLLVWSEVVELRGFLRRKGDLRTSEDYEELAGAARQPRKAHKNGPGVGLTPFLSFFECDPMSDVAFPQPMLTGLARIPSICLTGKPASDSP